MNKSQLLALAVSGLALISCGGRNSRPLFGLEDSTSNQWKKLELVLDFIENNYVDSIDHHELSEELIVQAIKSLDPHSVYLPPRDLEKSNEELEGEFDGIGITFNVPEDTAVVISTIVGGPSEKAGLLSGDRIISIDSVNVAGNKTNQDSLVRMMRGKAGTKVSLGILRQGVPDLLYFDVIRDKIPVHSVDCAFMVNDTTGYIRLSRFAKSTYDEFLAATLELQSKGMNRLILDLRDNLGGFMNQALAMSNEFLRDGETIVYMEGNKRPKEIWYAQGNGMFMDIRLDVLVNEASASSSEILAGAIQDNDRGKIYGRRTFGKGLVQEPVFFTDGSGMRITVAKFYTPSGRCIQKPYVKGEGDEYNKDILDRYLNGEMLDADSIKINDSLAYKTAHGRTVYGGGGIIPDVFVPIDTTSVNSFYLNCMRRGLHVRFSTIMNDRYKDRLSQIETFEELEAFMDEIGIEKRFLDYAASQNVPATAKEWAAVKEYMMVYVKALVGRYSALEDTAFYRYFLDIDKIYQACINDV